MYIKLWVFILVISITARLGAECQEWTRNGNQTRCTNDPSDDPLRNGQFQNSMNNFGSALGAFISRARANRATQQQGLSQQSRDDYQPTAAQQERRDYPEQYDATPNKRGHLNVGLIPRPEAVKLNLPTTTIYTILAGGAADKAGLKGGDVIHSIAGLEVKTSESLLNTMGNSLPGDAVLIGYIRQGEEKVVQVILN